MMEERRQHNRHPIELQLEVFDQHTQQRLGRIVDISQDGFMLFSEVPMEADSVWACRLETRPPLPSFHPVEFGADCLWTRPGGDGQHSWAGFHIIDIDDIHNQHLSALLEHLPELPGAYPAEAG